MGKPADYVPLAEREFCRNGHRIAEVGLRYSGRYPRCRACHNLAVRKCQAGIPRARLPMTELEPYITPERIRAMPHNLQRSYYRSIKQGWAGIGVADRLAIFFGQHPSYIWGDDFYTGCEEDA